MVRAVIAAVGALSFTIGLGAASPLPAYAATQTISYQASSAIIANPERGLYRHQSRCDQDDFKVATLTSYRTSGQSTLVMCLFYLEEFVNSPISSGQLARLERQAVAVRSAGLKMILRFAYTDDPDQPVDATLVRIQSHLDQLAGFFTKNRDVIDVVQSGFVGAWGEGAYSQNFGTAPNISDAQWAARKAVIDKLLAVVPASRMVQVRTPTMKRTMYGIDPISAAQAYRNLPVARVGHHNDCFLASTRDAGTYQDTAVEYPYLAADTTYVAMGGETCKLNSPRSDCPTALDELSRFHYSYLNQDYKGAVLQSWRDGGCFPKIEQSLGYRFALISASLPTTAVRGGSVAVQLKVDNRGWSTPHNERLVYLVLRHSATGQKIRLRINSDPRRWTAGAVTTVSQSLTVPSTVAAGSYSAYLQLADPVTALASKPAYSIQLANTVNGVSLWEPATGFNRLQMNLTVA